jgi:NADPH-dependent 2,4-dienoyl-CoA reductase/sulfur reductase-like enzyme
MNTAGNRNDGIVIAGGGRAGQRCAETLRRLGYEGAIRLVCAEPHRPYDRPPLSKELLIDAGQDAGIPFRPDGWYSEHSVDLLLGVAATGLEPAERRVALSDGGSLRYERLLIATGARPRMLPLLAGCENVSALRTIDDARALREVLATRPRLGVIGAGFIGLEVAATARELGVEVTIVEAAAWPLAGVLGPELGRWFAWLHELEGADVLTGVTVDGAAANGTVRALRLSDGSTLAVDHIVVGIGTRPDIAWLAGSGLEASVGVPVDANGQTAIEGVFAAGDAAATFDERCGCFLAGSHWEAAGRQGARAARVMLGLDPGAPPPASFWTDQYGLRIQYIGQARFADSVEIDGDLEARDFTAIFSRAGRAVAALLVGRPRSLPAARNLIEKGMHDHDLSGADR